LNVLTLSNALLITFCVPSYYDDIHALVGLADGAHSFGNSVSRDFVQPTFVSLLQNTCISIYIRNSSLYIGVVTFQISVQGNFLSSACVRVRLRGHATNWNRGFS
jgi:hypothetical protein